MIEFGYDESLRARVVTFSATVDDAEVLGAYEALLRSPDFDPTLNVLVDLRRVERLDVSSDAMRSLIQSFKPVEAEMSRTRRAVVAGDDVAFGLARMFELLRSAPPDVIRVFRHYTEACEWLRDAPARPPAG